MSQEHEGWKNYETHSVVQSLSKNVPYCEAIIEFMADYHGNQPYKDFLVDSGLDGQFTHDVVKYVDPSLDYEALNNLMWEMAPNKPKVE